MCAILRYRGAFSLSGFLCQGSAGLNPDVPSPCGHRQVTFYKPSSNLSPLKTRPYRFRPPPTMCNRLGFNWTSSKSAEVVYNNFFKSAIRNHEYLNDRTLAKLFHYTNIYTEALSRTAKKIQKCLFFFFFLYWPILLLLNRLVDM